ncbi:unnamed protein product [Penicillium egyptiacum]|uniref:C2H2-type domain-containing protein n=1 Tax=Penicillium egyptiacum TaxID=1303716 RepID=A0A9W4KJ25_9EURO|nr:unnamed protein product [Penicillium egyptiacum]
MAHTKQPRVSDNDKDPRRFKCTSCNKSFKRSEHCARHELMHTQERPFPCRKCGKRYGRKDLLRRHERTIHAEQYVNDDGHDMPENSPSSNASENSDPCDPTNMQDSRREAPALHNIPSSLPQPLGKDARSQDTQDSNAPSLPGEVGSTLQAAPLMYHVNGLSPPLGSSLRQDGLQFPSLSTFGDHGTPMGSDPLFMHLLLGGTPDSTRYTGIDGMNRTVLTTNGEREIPPTSASPQDVNLTIAGANPSSVHPMAAWGTNPGAGFLEGLGPMDFQLDLGTSPSDTWSGDPSNLTRSLPTIRREKFVQSPQYLINETDFERIHKDASVQLGNSGPDCNFLKLNELQQFIKSYVECFHKHLPFIHLPSFSPLNTPSPLIFAMASIGALYRLKRRRAYDFFRLSETIQSAESCFRDVQQDGFHDAGPFIPVSTLRLYIHVGERLTPQQEYQWRRIDLQNIATNRETMTWSDWINFEETKRALCAMFILSDSIMITFNITPGFVIDRDLMIEAPDDDELWAAKTAEEWEELQRSHPNNPQHTIQSILECMIRAPPTTPNNKPCRICGFTALVVMHAINIYLWHLNQLAQSVSSFSLGIWPHENLRTTLLRAAMSTLERTEAALQAGRSDDYKLAWDDLEHVLVFNCSAVLRAGYSRLLPPSHSFNRLVLLVDDHDALSRAAKTYVNAPLERNEFVTEAARKAYEGFKAPVTIGATLVSKTAAFSWSLEQAVAGWDSALLLTKWIYSMEVDAAGQQPSTEELQLVDDLRSLLAEMQYEHELDNEVYPLAALLARAWATLLGDVWVWGITPRMAEILNLLAVEYQRQADSDQGNTAQ